jgi:hypothetical protein
MCVKNNSKYSTGCRWTKGDCKADYEVYIPTLAHEYVDYQ